MHMSGESVWTFDSTRFFIDCLLKNIFRSVRPSMTSIRYSHVITDMRFTVILITVSLSILVSWVTPPCGVFKLNTDCSSIDGIYSGGYVLRDYFWFYYSCFFSFL